MIRFTRLMLAVIAMMTLVAAAGADSFAREARCSGSFSAFGMEQEISADKTVSLVPNGAEEGNRIASITSDDQSVEIRVQQGVNEKVNVLRIIRVRFFDDIRLRGKRWAIESASAMGDGRSVVGLHTGRAEDATSVECMFAD